jgi:hypothetical protein
MALQQESIKWIAGTNFMVRCSQDVVSFQQAAGSGVQLCLPRASDDRHFQGI